MALQVNETKSSSAELGLVCAGFTTTEAAPDVKQSNDMALVHRHSFHRCKINRVC